MSEIIIENAVHIAATLLVTLIGVLGAWLTARIAKRSELASISAASAEAVRCAQLTVLELQQTVVEGWKAASEDGRLTEDEVQKLGQMLVRKAGQKLSDPAKKLLTAAGVDITALIKAAGEAMVCKLKIEN